MSQKRSPHWLRTIFVALLLGAGLITGILMTVDDRISAAPSLPVETSLYVSDWEIKKIYGPGTSEQKQMVNIFREIGISGFSTPFLYRMGGSASENGSEAIMMWPFRPEKPHEALTMKFIP